MLNFFKWGARSWGTPKWGEGDKWGPVAPISNQKAKAFGGIRLFRSTTKIS